MLVGAVGEEEPTRSLALTCLLTLINLFISILYFPKQDLDNTCKRTKKKEPKLGETKANTFIWGVARK